MKVPRRLFEQLTEDALAEIPRPFRTLLHNLEISVKALPGREAGRLKGSRTLLGLYQGLTREEMRGASGGSHLPSRIILYQRNIAAGCASEAELRRGIRDTLRHEIAHHFGFSEADIRERWPEGA